MYSISEKIPQLSVPPAAPNDFLCGPCCSTITSWFWLDVPIDSHTYTQACVPVHMCVFTHASCVCVCACACVHMFVFTHASCVCVCAGPRYTEQVDDQSAPEGHNLSLGDVAKALVTKTESSEMVVKLGQNRSEIDPCYYQWTLVMVY